MLTVGEILRKERELKGISLKDIEKKTRVREKYLAALENNNWDFFSSKIYIIGIIKSYSRILGLEIERMLAFFRRDYERQEEVKFKKRIASKYLTSQTRRLALLGVAAAFLFFFFYFGYQLKNYFTPPRVDLLSPKNVNFKSEESVKIIGQTQKEAAISIFGSRVFQNKAGIFEYDFPLHTGKNELIIEVTGANGKKNIFKKTFFRAR